MDKKYSSQLNLSEKQYMLLTFLVIIIYYIFSRFDGGFYSHDEIGHFHNMQKFWIEPSTILSVWGKPGWKLFYSIPSLFGSDFVIITTCVFTGITAYVASLVAKQYGIKDRAAVLLLCASMPMLYQISFRFYAEPLVGLFLILSIFFYKKEKYILAALCASYLFPIRHENALYAIIMGVLFLRDKRYIPFLALGASPIILHLVGWAVKGDPLYLMNEIIGGPADYNWPEPGFFHLWKVFLPIAGPVLAFLSMVGIFGFFVSNLGWRKYLKKYELLYIAFIPIFILHCLTCEPLFPYIKLTGNWKVVTPFAPILALFAGIGLMFLRSKNKNTKTYVLIISILLAIAAFIYSSYEHNHFTYLQERNYTLPSILIAVSLFALAYRYIKVKDKYLGLSFGILAMIFTIAIEKPFPLAAEDTAVKEATTWLKSQNIGKTDKVYVRHPVFYYFMNTSAKDRQNDYGFIESEDHLNSMPTNSKVIWESHYTSRYSKVDVSFFQNNPNYEMQFQKMTDNRKFYIAIFNKL